MIAEVTRARPAHSAVSLRKRIFRAIIVAFFVLYSLGTLFPFYVLIIRTFVGTKDSTTLHLWLPPDNAITMDAELGNTASFYNLDIRQFKKDFGITGYVATHTTFREIADKFNIPEEKIRAYFAPFGRLNGWYVLFRGGEIWPAMARTMVVTAGSIIGLNLLGLLTGYGLASLKHRLHLFVYNLYLLEMVIPGMLILLPQFLIVQWLIGLVPGSREPGVTRYVAQLLSLIALGAKGGALSTMLFTSSVGAIPNDLEEAAMMDGASRLQYFFSVVMPLMKVPVACLTVMVLPEFWNQFLGPYVYLDPANSTLIPLIQSFAGRNTTNYQAVSTGILVSVVPLAVVYVAFRRWFISGVMSGAVKG